MTLYFDHEMSLGGDWFQSHPGYHAAATGLELVLEAFRAGTFSRCTYIGRSNAQHSADKNNGMVGKKRGRSISHYVGSRQCGRGRGKVWVRTGTRTLYEDIFYATFPSRGPCAGPGSAWAGSGFTRCCESDASNTDSYHKSVVQVERY
jgi:hypothetical protein